MKWVENILLWLFQIPNEAHANENFVINLSHYGTFVSRTFVKLSSKFPVRCLKLGRLVRIKNWDLLRWVFSAVLSPI